MSAMCRHYSTKSGQCYESNAYLVEYVSFVDIFKLTSRGIKISRKKKENKTSRVYMTRRQKHCVPETGRRHSNGHGTHEQSEWEVNENAKWRLRLELEHPCCTNVP